MATLLLVCAVVQVWGHVPSDGTAAGEGPHLNALVVETRSGRVKGFEQEGSLAFLGIPYAKVERFQPPKAVDRWDTLLVCDHWGPQAMQMVGGRQLSEAEMSEKNCCVLNVWTTDCQARKPVMVWLHGGGFDSGTSAWNPGMALAKKDVVVVSVNHRLNILGFFNELQRPAYQQPMTIEQARQQLHATFGDDTDEYI